MTIIEFIRQPDGNHWTILRNGIELWIDCSIWDVLAVLREDCV